MVQVHKYLDYGASATLVIGMQCVLAPTSGIPYYALGVGVSYFATNTLANLLLGASVCLVNSSGIDSTSALGKAATLFVHNYLMLEVKELQAR